MKTTKNEQIVISLVKCALDNKPITVENDVDWEAILKLSVVQKLMPLVCSGILNSGIVLSPDLQEKIDKKLLSYFIGDQKQQLELKKIYEVFDAEGIDYMPVKGALLKKLYPSTDLRPMGDADILIRIGQKEKAFKAMESLGFNHVQDSAHEFIFAKNGVNIELHKCLVPPYNEDYYSYFGEGWQRANKVGDTTRYALSDDDHFIYMLAHFAKHYRDGGISALHIVDFWLYKQKKTLDEDYICNELAKLGLDAFYKNVMDTMRVWFAGESSTEMTEFITSRIFNNGTWGTKETQLRAKGAKAAKTGKNITVSLIFPSAESLQYRFPILQKHRYLLPVMWGVRWFDVLIFKRNKIHDRFDENKHIDAESVSSYQKELNYVGLDFNNKE